MDILILVGFVVILLMVVSPILAIIAMHRVSRMRSQLSELNQRVISLEQALKPDAGSLENSQSELVHTAEMASSEKKTNAANFISRTPSLSTQFNWSFNHKCIIGAAFANWRNNVSTGIANLRGC